MVQLVALVRAGHAGNASKTPAKAKPFKLRRISATLSFDLFGTFFGTFPLARNLFV
jgi:hypothetical protein